MRKNSIVITEDEAKTLLDALEVHDGLNFDDPRERKLIEVRTKLETRLFIFNDRREEAAKKSA